MKRILILAIAAFITVLAACKKDELATVNSNITAPVLTAPVTAAAIAVTPADSAQKLKIKWNKADYGVKAVVTYFVQADVTGNSFKSKITLGTTNADTLSLTLGAINNRLLASLGLAANAASVIDLRTGAAIYGKDTVYSQTVKLTVTTFKELAPTKLYVPGAYQGWSPGTALSIPAVTTYTYEGYIYMNVGDQFKFTTSPDWDHVNYGYAGTAGKLTADGLAGGIFVTAPGYYKLNADIKNLTWSATLVSSFGIIGTATPGQWDNSTAMTYSISTNTWKIILNLVAGALKFRANNAWDLSYGPADPNALTGTLIQTNDAITITAAGNYTVTMNLSQSTQNKYLYTVVKN